MTTIQIKPLWGNVAEVFERDRCDPDCPYLGSTTGGHLEGYPPEQLCECTLQADGGTPEDCPAVEDLLEEQALEAANDEEPPEEDDEATDARSTRHYPSLEGDSDAQD